LCKNFAHLNDALFTLADLIGASLSSADLRSPGFLLRDCLYQLHRASYDAIVKAMRRHDLLQTYLLKANLHACDLRSAHLQGAMFHQANLRIANLRKAEICKTDFQEADLSGPDLRGAYIIYINSRHTVMTRQTQINDRWRRISFLQSNKLTEPYLHIGFGVQNGG
jgi:uncharacterized protein YjbI with pentapeptide repeats